MDWVTHAVSAFGQSLGIAQLELDADGCALFALGTGGHLALQDLQASGGNEVLVVLARPLPQPHAGCARRALALVDFRAAPGWPMQVALRGEDLVATLRMPRHSFMLSALEEAVDALFAFHERVAQAH
jgi:type III secretion system chaperone SycN